MSVEELRDELDVNEEEVEDTESSEIDDDANDFEDDDVSDDDETEPETAEDNDESEDDEVLDFTFDEDGGEDADGDPYAGQPAPDWVKQLRKENRELKREKREREAQQQQVQRQALPEMPSIADFDYDEDSPEYKAALENYVVEKQKYESRIKAEEERLQNYENRYIQSVDKLRAKAPDYDDVEGVVADVLPPQRQAMIKVLVGDPARLAYTLGKSPKTLDELSKMDDIQFIKQVTLMEQKMAKPKSRNPAKPKPKSHELTGGAGGGDTQLAKLEAQAAKTGDRSKVIAYKRKLKQSK